MDDLVDQKFNVRLVQAVEKYPILYKTTIKGFHRKRCIRARERAWKEIGEELNCDVTKMKVKWQCFRSNLNRKERQRQRGLYVPQYYLHDHIKYVIPYLKNSQKTTDDEAAEEEAEEEVEEKHVLEDENESVEDYEVVDEIDDADQDTMSFKNYNYLLKDEIITDELTEKASSPLPSPKRNSNAVNNYSLEEGIISDELTEKASSSLLSPKRYRNVVKNRDVVTTSTQSTPLWNATQIASSSIGNAGLDESINDENAKRHFLFSLLPDLDEMTNSQMRYFKCQVLNLIHEILKEN